MIPITVALMGGESAGARSRWRPFALTLSYAIGLALSLRAARRACGALGNVVRQRRHEPMAVVFAMGNLLLLFALVMLDALRCRFPRG